METSSVTPDNSRVLTVKLGSETSPIAYSTDKRSNAGGNSAMDHYPIQGGVLRRNTPSRFMLHATETGRSSGLMGH